MPVQFSEASMPAIEQGLLAMAEQGVQIDLRAVLAWESVVAQEKKGPAGYAIAHAASDGRHLTVHANNPKDVGLTRKLLDQGLAKTASAGRSATHLSVPSEAADAGLWNKANWLNSLPKLD